MDNKHRKLYITKQPKGCEFMPKMHQIRLAAVLRPDSLGELKHSPGPPSRNGGILIKGEGETERGEGRKLTYKGSEERGGAYF